MIEKKPIIIGQAPARGNDGKPPFSGRSGARLARLAGVGNTGDVLPEYFDLINLIDYWPGKAGKGDAFDPRQAQISARKLARDLDEESRKRCILMMGKKVRRAMGVNGDWAYLEWFNFGLHRAAVFPHPSGINHWWNDPTNTAQAELFLRRLVWGLEVRHG